MFDAEIMFNLELIIAGTILFCITNYLIFAFTKLLTNYLLMVFIINCTKYITDVVLNVC